MKTLNEFITELVEQVGESKINRSAFIYLAPKQPKNKFAQCETCFLFLPGKKRCGIFGEDNVVVANASCGFYLNGKPDDDQPIRNCVTPEEAGYVHGQVRCENCTWLDKGNVCGLYKMLNKKAPDTFDLDEIVDPKGCCNAWESK